MCDPTQNKGGWSLAMLDLLHYRTVRAESTVKVQHQKQGTKGWLPKTEDE